MSRTAVLCLLIYLPMCAQDRPSGPATATGACNVVISGSGNAINIKTCGLTNEQNAEWRMAFKQILEKQVDPKVLVRLLNDIKSGISRIENDIVVMNSYGSPVTGELIPANDPDPPVPPTCSMGRDAMKVYMGGSVAFAADEEQREFRAIAAGKNTLLTIKRRPQGILIDANFTADEGKTMTLINDNSFTVNANITLIRRTPDKSTLEVIDQFGKQALWIRFLNPHSIKIIGTFPVGNGRTLQIGQDAITILPQHIMFADHTCLGGGRDGLSF